MHKTRLGLYSFGCFGCTHKVYFLNPPLAFPTQMSAEPDRKNTLWVNHQPQATHCTAIFSIINHRLHKVQPSSASSTTGYTRYSRLQHQQRQATQGTAIVRIISHRLHTVQPPSASRTTGYTKYSRLQHQEPPATQGTAVFSIAISTTTTTSIRSTLETGGCDGDAGQINR